MSVLNAVRKITGEPVVVGPASLSSEKTALDVRVYGDITDLELQAYTAQRLGGLPDQWRVRWDAA